MDMHALAMGELVTTADGALVSRIAELEAENAQLRKKRDQLRASHVRLREELELLKRRNFVAKAERVDTAPLEMEFAEKLRQLDALAGTLADTSSDDDNDDDASDKKKPTGRRDLRKLPLEEERIEIADPLYEELVAQGKATRIDFEESCKLAYKHGGMRRIVVARVEYQVVGKDGETAIDTAPMPLETFPRSLAAPSLLVRIPVDSNTRSGHPIAIPEHPNARSERSDEGGQVIQCLSGSIDFFFRIEGPRSSTT